MIMSCESRVRWRLRGGGWGLRSYRLFKLARNATTIEVLIQTMQCILSALIEKILCLRHSIAPVGGETGLVIGTVAKTP